MSDSDPPPSVSTGPTPTTPVEPRRGTHHDVFVCHSSDDKAIADAIVATLEGAGVRCWIAPRDVIPGDSYVEDIVAAIEDSRLVVFVFSSSSNESPHVTRELGHAVNAGISILPFRIEDITPSPTVEFYISGAHWLDAMTPPLREHLSRLAETTRLLIGFDADLPGAPVLPSVAPTGTPPPIASPPGKGARERLPWIVGAVSAALILVVAVVVFLARGDGGQADRADETFPSPTDASPGPAAPGTVGDTRANEFEAGECTNDDLDGLIAEIDTVDCAEPHTGEAYAQFDLEGDDFPGVDAVSAEGGEGCTGSRFEDYVGISYAESIYEAEALTPSEQSWNEAADRTVICVITGTVDGSPLEGSAKDTGV
jgi:hypothetical protein